MGMATAADVMGQIGTVAAATTAVAFVLSLGRDGTWTRRRRAQLAGLAMASVLFLVHATLARSVADGMFPTAADLPLLAWMVAHRTDPLTALFGGISAVGGTVGMAVLGTVAAILFWVRRRLRVAFGIAGATLGAGLLVVGFKHLYGRSRPPSAVQLVPQTSLSFPSGHSLGSIVVIGMLTVLVGRELRSTVLRAALATTSSAAVALIGVSRLYLGVHWLSDVLAGWLLGGAWLALCLVVTLSGRQGVRDRPAAPAESKKSDNSSPEIGRSGVVPAAPGDHITDTTKETYP